MDELREFPALDLSNRRNEIQRSPYFFPARDHPKPILTVEEAASEYILTEFSDMTNSSDHPLSCDEIGRLLLSDDLKIGIDYLMLYLYPFLIRRNRILEWDEPPRLANDQQSMLWRTKRIIQTGHEVDVFMRQNIDHPDAFMSVSFNPSENSTLVSVSDSISLIETVLDDVAELVSLAGDLSEIRIGRVDVSADFSPVSDLELLRRVLTSAAPKPRWGKNEYLTSGGGGGWTVEHRTKYRGKVIAYNKSAKSRLPLPTVRFEARIDKGARGKYELRTIGDLKESALLQVLKDYVEPFAESLIQSGTVDDALAAFKPRIINEAIGALWCEENGFPVPVDRDRRALHRNVYKALSVSSISDLLADG